MSVKILISLFSGFTAGYAIGKNYKGIKRILRHYLKISEKGPVDQCESQESGMTQVATSFAQKASSFSGCFEPLYRASMDARLDLDKACSILQEWNIRLSKSDEPIFAWWKSIYTYDNPENCRRTIRQILEMVRLSGVIRDQQEEFVVDNSSRLAYLDWQDAFLEEGITVKVISAAWFKDSHCIEQGIVKLI